jgi:2,5-diketo-D-gluconate reductase B
MTRPPAPSPSSASHVVVGEGESHQHPLGGDAANSDTRFADQRTVELLSGRRMPALGLGTWQLEGEECRRMVSAAFDLGIRHLDTAQAYGNEADVGAAVTASAVDRDDVFITTKIGNDRHEPGPLVESVRASLDRLQTDHVDLLLMHWPVEFERVGATLSALAQVQASGMAHHIGVSNFTIEQLDQAAEFAPLEVLQCECHPFLQQRELRDWCESRSWAFTAYSPLARGDVMDDDVLADIANKHSTSAAGVTVAWLLSLRRVTTIPKTTDPDHLADNLAAAKIELDHDDLDRIAALDEGRRLVDPEHAPW